MKQSDGKGVSKERRNLESKDAVFVLYDVHRRRSFRLENTSAIDSIFTNANPNDILDEDRVTICLQDTWQDQDRSVPSKYVSSPSSASPQRSSSSKNSVPPGSQVG